MRVATWNIRAAIGPGEPFPAAWWRHVSRARFERIGNVIADLDADVVALQEVSIFNVDGEVHDQPLELARMTGREVRYAAVHAFPLVEPETGRAIGTATWGNALLTRRPVMDGFARALPLGGDPDLVEPAGSRLPLAGVSFLDAPYGTREPRCAVGGRVEVGGQSIGIVNAHLAYAGQAQRQAQASALAQIAAELDGLLVVLGDFNAAIESLELAALASTLEDGFAAVGVPSGDDRRASSRSARIDHVLARGLRFLDCHVERAAGDASDHLPVIATLALA